MIGFARYNDDSMSGPSASAKRLGSSSAQGASRRPRTRGDFRGSPMIVFYEVTRACDLVCLHCRACAQSKPDPTELTSIDAKRLVDQLTEFPEPPMLVLTGGDPLKRADIFELIEYAVSRKLEVSITPSATPLVTEAAIRKLQAAGISRMAISIDGADAGTHDGVRGVLGSFDRSLAILSEARSIGLETQINTVLTPQNVDQIEAMADQFARLNIALWSVFFLVPVGRGDQLDRLSARECESAFERLWQQSMSQPYMIKTTEAPHYRRFLIQHRRSEATQPGSDRKFIPPPIGINDGKGIMFVSHAGIVQPSGFLPIACGVFPFEHLVKVYQESPVFKGLRDSDRLEGKCHVCEFRNVCGGSRARSFAVTGSVFAQEPDCVYVPKAAPL